MRLTRPEGDEFHAGFSRRAMLAGSMFTIGYAASMLPAQASAITTDTDGLIIDEPTFRAHGGFKMPGYLARPATLKRAAPAILVINEVFGVHAYIKDICRRLAKLGFVALAPDYFRRVGDPSTLADFKEIMPLIATARQPQVLGDTEAALRYLNMQTFVTPARVGITGFCWGGKVVWLACEKLRGIKAGVAWYGRLRKPESGPGSAPEDFAPINLAASLKAPVLGLYGGKDEGIPVADVEAMRAALAEAGNPTNSELVVYPDAEHGFHADYRPSYNPTAAADGWKRMLAWFKAHGLE